MPENENENPPSDIPPKPLPSKKGDEVAKAKAIVEGKIEVEQYKCPDCEKTYNRQHKCRLTNFRWENGTIREKPPKEEKTPEKSKPVVKAPAAQTPKKEEKSSFGIVVLLSGAVMLIGGLVYKFKDKLFKKRSPEEEIPESNSLYDQPARRPAPTYNEETQRSEKGMQRGPPTGAIEGTSEDYGVQ